MYVRHFTVGCGNIFLEFKKLLFKKHSEALGLEISKLFIFESLESV